MIYLDTSFLINALVSGTSQSQQLDQWIAEGVDLRVSATAWCEFLCGPINADHVALARAVIGEALAFLSEDAVTAATLFNSTGRRRGSLLDCMIAAVAIRHGAMIATDNADDFRRFESQGLRLA